MPAPTYSETLEFLYSQLPMFQRQGKPAFKKDLTNTRALCDLLDHPERKFRSVHIAGTNGKGSVAHMLAAVLQAHGWKVGLYTSPHYVDFRERIKINGTYISEAEVIDFVQRIRPHLEPPPRTPTSNPHLEVGGQPLRPSFFEMTVAMAFDHFARHEVDLAVIETGLGGRLDSTNVIRPELSVITNISFDHMEFLGDTLPAIAGEKAGIIKPGIPVVIGERQQETTPVFLKKAELEGAPISWAEDDWEAQEVISSPGIALYEVKYRGRLLYHELEVDTAGPYQDRNLTTALATLEKLEERLPDFRVSEIHLREGLGSIRERAGLIGRWQYLQNDPPVLADSAHNEGGLTLVMERLRRLEYKELHFVVGVTREKDLSKLFTLLPGDARYYFAKADIPRGLPAEELHRSARAAGLRGEAYSSVRAALDAAKAAAGPDDLIFVGGSIFVVGEAIDQ